jgi:type II secretory pathway predicted ATPase ExeA
MPVEIEVDGRLTTVPMTGGRGQITVPAGAHILIDPESKVLRRLDFIEVWKGREPR